MNVSKNIIIISIFFLFFSLCLQWSGLLSNTAAYGKEKKIETIDVEIIKDKDEKEKPKTVYNPAKIEKARSITSTRLLGLAFFWLIVLTLFVILRKALKHEKRLLDEGYYKTDLTH